MESVPADVAVISSEPWELTLQEKEWLAALEPVASEMGYKCSVFELAQFAIVTKGSIEKASKRLASMQRWRELYNIEELKNKDIAFSVIDVFLAKVGDDVFFDLGRDRLGVAGIGMNLRSFRPESVSTEEDYALLIRFLLIVYDGLCFNLKEIRCGMSLLNDCTDMGFENFSLEMQKRSAEFYQNCYPVKVKNIFMINLPMLLWVILEIVSVFLTQKLRERIRAISTGPDLDLRFNSTSLPPRLGGTYVSDMSLADVLKARWLRRQESIETVKL